MRFSTLHNAGLSKNSATKQKLIIFGSVLAIVLAGFVLSLAITNSSRVAALTLANGDFEAENITNVSSSNIKKYTDSSASGGKALQFWVNGTATKAATTPSVTKITVFAKGVLCNGAPIMTVSVNGAQVINTPVNPAAAYTGFSADIALSAGSQSVQVGFTNDYYVSPSCDRNLIVDKVEFTPGTITPPPTCDTTAPLPSNADPGTLVLADGFESNDFNNWTTVTQNGDATATVQKSVVKSNACAALIHVTSNTGSRANIAKTLPAASHEVWATGWFNITREGASTASNVPTFRLFNGTSRLLDVSRQNGSGSFFVRWPTATGQSINSTGRTLNLNQWYQIKIHTVANGSSSQVEVWLDGTKVFDRTSAATGYATFGSFTNFTSLQIGAEHVLQDGDFAADDIVAKVLQ